MVQTMIFRKEVQHESFAPTFLTGMSARPFLTILETFSKISTTKI